MENHRQSQDQTKGEKKKAQKKQWNAVLTKIRWSFYEFYIFGWCWIGSFGFDKYGNTYERKKVKQ